MLLRSIDVRDVRNYLDYVCTEPLHTIRPALERAFSVGGPACVNIITDPEIGFGHSGAAAH